jgi:hypothetical protein
VKIRVDGKQDTAKGFNVFVMSAAESQAFRSKRPFNYIQSLSAPKTRAFGGTATLPAGDWVVVIENSENLLRDMTVHLSVIVDPR